MTMWRLGGLVVAPVWLMACAPAGTTVSEAERTQLRLNDATRRLLQTPERVSDWTPLALPGKRAAVFEPMESHAVPALRVQADDSVSILRQRFAAPLAGGQHLSFQWKADGLPRDADLAVADRSDSPVGVLLAFDGDRSRWTPRDHRFSELTRLLTGEELPYATLAYVWSPAAPVGTVVVNPRSGRIRKLVLDSGVTELGRWRRHERDLQADFRLAFGEDPGPLRAVALMTDTDNTRSRLTAWYGPLHLRPAQP